MQPIGWYDINVPRRAPMRETRVLKMGIPLAITYEATVMEKVQPIQVAQCINELSVRCRDPRKMRKKMCLLGN